MLKLKLKVSPPPVNFSLTGETTAGMGRTCEPCESSLTGYAGELVGEGGKRWFIVRLTREEKNEGGYVRFDLYDRDESREW